MKFSREQKLSFGIALVLSVLFVWLLLREIENKEIWDILRGIDGVLALAALGIYMLIYLSRALRFNSLFKRPIALSKMLTITCLHTMITTIMPARMGELSYPYLLQKQGVKYAESLSTLIAGRLFDLVAVGVWFAAMLPFLHPVPTLTLSMLYTLLGMVTVAFLVLGTLILWKLQIKVLIETLRGWLGLRDNRWLSKLQQLGGEVLDTIKSYSRRGVLCKLIIHSLLQWLLMFLFSFTILLALGMEVTIPQSFVGSALAMVVFLVPFQGMLGFGTTEAVWVLMFIALGFPKEQLIPLAFAAHIVSLLCTGVMGVYGLSRMGMLTRARSRRG